MLRKKNLSIRLVNDIANILYNNAVQYISMSINIIVMDEVTGKYIIKDNYVLWRKSAGVGARI